MRDILGFMLIFVLGIACGAVQEHITDIQHVYIPCVTPALLKWEFPNDYERIPVEESRGARVLERSLLGGPWENY